MRLDDARARLEALADEVPASKGTITLDGDVLRIDNPRAKGALTVRMMAQLAARVEELAASEQPWVIVRGTPGSFCSGGHLRQVQAALLEPGQGLAMSAPMTCVLDALQALPMLVIAAIDGPALGGGAELAVSCDHRVMGSGARLQFVHARLGVAPGWGGARRLVGLTGRTAALRLLTASTALEPSEARAQGLCDASGEDLDAVLEAFLEPLRRASPAAIRACKAQVVAAEQAERSGAESRRFAEVWGGPEHRERLLRALRR